MPLREEFWSCDDSNAPKDVCDEIGGKGAVGAIESAVFGAEFAPSSKGPLKIESGDPLLNDCSTGIMVLVMVSVVVVVVIVVVVVSSAADSFDLVG